MNPVSSSPQTSDQNQQLNRIVELLERIEQFYYPPLWKRVLSFLFAHLLSLVVLAFLAYVTWKIWGIVDGVQHQVSSMQAAFSSFSQSLAEQLAKLKFWE